MKFRNVPLYVGCLCFLIVIGCKEKPMEPDLSTAAPESVASTTMTKTMDRNQIHQELDKIAKFLAEKRTSIGNFLPARVRERQGEELLKKLSLAQQLQTAFMGSDGRIFEVTFALAKKSPVDGLSQELRVAVDPDDYPTEDPENFTVYSLDESGSITSESIGIRTYNQTTPYPLLLVNTNEVLTSENSLLGKFSLGNSTSSYGGGGGPDPGPYLSVREIDLHRENDPLGYEEFEIYVREDDAIAAEWLDTCTGLKLGTVVDVHKYTSLIFDGSTSRKDAANRTRTWPDINVDEGTYVMPSDIALVRLSSGKRGLTPIRMTTLKVRMLTTTILMLAQHGCGFKIFLSTAMTWEQTSGITTCYSALQTVDRMMSIPIRGFSG